MSKRLIIVSLVAVPLLAAGLILLDLNMSRTHRKEGPGRPAAAATVKPASPTPTVNPSASAAPVNRLQISAIGVDAPVIAVGLTNDGALDAPKTLYQVGVYAGGPWPGQPGTAVVDGHSGAPDQVGVLEHLNRVKVGDMVTMVNVSGQKTLFKVTTSKAYPATAATAGVLFAKTTTATMNIISCYGNWDAKSQTYDQRWLLTTELVK